MEESSTNVRMVPLRALGAQRREGVREGAQELGQERDAHLFDLPRRDGRFDESIEGSADGEAFALYIERFLCPELKEGQIVVMDNLQVHKMKRVRDLIEGRGCSLEFLPPTRPTSTP